MSQQTLASWLQQLWEVDSAPSLHVPYGRVRKDLYHRLAPYAACCCKLPAAKDVVAQLLRVLTATIRASERVIS